MDSEFFRNWTDQIRKGVLELLLLSEIHRHGSYAYEIEQRLCKSCGLLMGHGVIYKMLSRFRRHRLVRTVERRSPDGPGRKYYELTESGRQTLAQMNAYWQSLETQAQAVTGSRRIRSVSVEANPGASA